MANKRTRGPGRSFLNRVPDDQVRRANQVGVSHPFCSGLVMLAGLFLIYRVAEALNQLQLVESERDRWQRPKKLSSP